MKKIIRFLFMAALLFAVAETVIVSCQKGGGEEDIDGATSSRMPRISPGIEPSRDTYTIRTDGTTLSRTSSGYSFDVMAGAITFNSFTCYLIQREYFILHNECDLTLKGSSVFKLFDLAKFGGSHITLSGSGSIKFIAGFINEMSYNDKFSAAEGYTLTCSGKETGEDGMQSCTWTIKKSQ